MNNYISIIGGGLAGCEAAYQIAKRGIKVKLYEMKPVKFSPAHSNKNLAEIVCSNSFKSNLHTNACGLLKEELRMLDSLLIKIADEVSVPAGQALAVDREKFAKEITRQIESLENVEIIRMEIGKSANKNTISNNKEDTSQDKTEYSNNYTIREKARYNEDVEIKGKIIDNENDTKIKEIYNKENNIKEQVKEQEIVNNFKEISLKQLAKDGIVIVATGPLTSDRLSSEIIELTGNDSLHFYDAAAPIVDKGSIDMNIAFWGDRYEQERRKDEDVEEWKKRINKNNEKNYINLPMNKEEYEKFWQELVNAEVVELHNFEKREIFEGCMPIEVMAKRGIDTLRFGPLKPVGFTDPRTGKRPYALVQLRQDNSEGGLFNMVGFQTNLKYGEQKRVFSLIPGLENAEFVKYGVMHRNTFINSPKLLDETYNLKSNNNIFFAGQITGVEGYVESIASGLVAGLNAAAMYKEKVENEINNSIGGNAGNEIKPKQRKDANVSNETRYEKNQINFKKYNISSNCKIIFPKETMIGALSKYISSENKNFQPMNANFGIVPELSEKIKDKKLKYGKLADRALEILKNILQ